MSQIWSQFLAVVRLEIRKSFLARRGLWVYLLALAPAILYLGHSIYAPREQQRLAHLAAKHPAPTRALQSLSVRQHLRREQVLEMLGQPCSQRTEFRHFGQRRVQRDWYRYTDGHSDYQLYFFDGELGRIEHDDPDTLADENVIFATIFQVYYIRLAIFFGCVGIFTNLFRGEMLDKSLHFYLLTPIRREVLLAGKFIAGLGAALVIFTVGTVLQLAAMLLEFKGPALTEYLHGPASGHIGAYLGVTALACIGYGSIFLATGLLVGNPIVPAALALLWESANLFIPGVLKKISIIFYLQSLCPVSMPPDSSLPRLLSLLISPPQSATTPMAIAAVGAVTLAAFAAATLKVRRLEINYSTE
jgi:ABC-type transport system involved in multi-copper enzyme maturation permease subunit